MPAEARDAAWVPSPDSEHRRGPLPLSWLEHSPVGNDESAHPVYRVPRALGLEAEVWLQGPDLFFVQLGNTGQLILLFQSPSANQTPMASWPSPDACAGEGTTQA